MRSMAPSSKRTRADPSIWIVSASDWFLIQQISRCLLAVKSAVEDLAAIVVGHQCTTGGSPQRLSLVGKAGTDAVARRYQIQRPAVDWDFEDSSGKPRAVDDRFIVTSQQSGAVAQLGYVQRAEIVFEKYPRLVICETANSKRLTTYLREGEVHRALIALLHAGAQQWRQLVKKVAKAAA